MFWISRLDYMPNEWSNVACINCPIQTQSVKLSTQQHEQAYKIFSEVGEPLSKV